MMSVSGKCHERKAYMGCFLWILESGKPSLVKRYMNRDLNIMTKQSQANDWEEHSKKRRTSSAKAVGQEHAWCVQGTAKRPVCVTLSELEDKDGRELLGPDPVMVSSESTLSGLI